MPDVVQRGWRYFVCNDCGARFREPSRDCESASGVGCDCGEWLFPQDAMPDESLSVDERTGNLIDPVQREKLV